MPSKFIMVSLLAICLFSCGELKPKNKTLLPSNDIGCFDKLGARVSKYIDGNIESDEWIETFTCVNDQVRFFKKYVRGSAANGYSKEDIAALIRKLLIVNRTVSDQFITSIFEIKASIFGGSSEVITATEIDQFLKFSDVLKTETLTLMPAVKARRGKTTSSSILQLTDSLNDFGNKLADFLGTLRGNGVVTKESYLPFIRELLSLHGGDVSLIDQYGDFARNIKVIITGGSPDFIETSAWKNLLREGISLGGIILAQNDMKKSELSLTDEGDVFDIEIAKRIQILSSQIIRNHGDGVPLNLFDAAIDTLPMRDLNEEKRTALKTDLRAIVFTMFKSGVPNLLTEKAIQNVYDLYESGMRSQIHLKRIYEGVSQNINFEDVKQEEFESLARSYLFRAGTGRERAEVNRLIRIAKNYDGLFPENSNGVEFTVARKETRTLNHMIRMSWFNLAIDYGFKVYASGPINSVGVRSACAEDLEKLTENVKNILIAWKLSNPVLKPIDVAKKRFREGNLFMPNSNGDKYFSPEEATYYIAFLTSASTLSERVFKAITSDGPDWKACPLEGEDELHQKAVKAECFRAIYFSHPEIFWNTFPGLQAAYAKMNPAQKAKLAHSMEQAARTGGYNPNPIGPFDVNSFAAIPHYIEDVMIRFDRNRNEVLDKNEILEKAFPIFRETLSTVPKKPIKSNIILRGILTYLMKFGVQPKSTAKLMLWIAELPFSDVTADRNSLYNVVALISSGIDIGTMSVESESIIPGVDLFPTVIPNR